MIPISYLWDGQHFVFAPPPSWYKAKSIAANPNVAFTVDTTEFQSLILSVRGVASIEYETAHRKNTLRHYANTDQAC